MLSPDAKSATVALPPPSTESPATPARWGRRGGRRSFLLVLLACALLTSLHLLPTPCSSLLPGTAHSHGSHAVVPSSHLPDTTPAHEPSRTDQTPAPLQTALSAPRTTQKERTGLLFQALAGGKPLPADWLDWLVPTTRPAQIKALEQLVHLGRTTPDDARLYRLHPIAWANQHARRGLLLISDSSRESQELVRLLDRLGATYTTQRMDLDPALIDVLRSLTNGNTTPTLFAGTAPVGGLDTVRNLHSLGVLQGTLRASDAL